jgi:Gpi18-like mannosyltransferase
MSRQETILSSEWFAVIVLLVGIKLAVLTIFAVSHYYMPKPVYQADTWMTRPRTTLVQNLANFDGAWFIRIAALGYQKLTTGDYDLQAETARLGVMDQLGYEDGTIRSYAYRHWPLFPLAIRAVGKVLAGNFLAAGILLANLFYFVYGVFFYKLMRTEFNDQTSLLALALALIHPGAYSLTAVYNEPLFLAFAAACFYYLKKDNHLLAGLFAGLAAMTRIEAVLLYVPIIYDYFRRNAPDSGGLLAPLRLAKLKAGLQRLVAEPKTLWLFLAPLGGVATLLYFKLTSGSAFIFMNVHEGNKYGHLGFPWQMLYATYLKGPETWHKELLLHALLLLVILFSFRKINWTWWVWMAAFWLFYTTNGNHSYLRYQVMCIPMFAALAKLLMDNKLLKYIYLTGSAAAMAFFAARYINGYWVA